MASERTRSPPARDRRMLVNPLSISSGRRASTSCSWTPNVRAAAFAWSRKSEAVRTIGFKRSATRLARGTIVLSNSSCLPVISGAIKDRPVTLPLRRVKFVARPVITGSKFTATIGIVCVTSRTARAVEAFGTTMTSGFSPTSPVARAPSRGRPRILWP